MPSVASRPVGLTESERASGKIAHQEAVPSRTLSSAMTNGNSSNTIQSSASLNGNAYKNRKKEKRLSPFRIKEGCVVALRYRPGGNRVNLVSATSGEVLTSTTFSNRSYSEVWTDPCHGRDEGLALIGKRVRCCFRKSVLSETYAGGKKATTRILEGEVVAIVDCARQLTEQKAARRCRRAYGTKVHLLIDQDRLNSLPFLKRMDEVVDPSKLSESARRGYINEQRIRGKNKALVEVILSDVSGIVFTEKMSESKVEAMWVIRKRVPSKLPVPVLVEKDDASEKQAIESDDQSNGDKTGVAFDDSTKNKNAGTSGDENASLEGKISNGGGENKAGVKATNPRKRRRTNRVPDTSAPRYLGDGNDPTEQQEKNWRWQAGRYNHLLLLKERPIAFDYLEYLSYGFIGEVIKLQPASPITSTLALVTLKRLILPEHTEGGRLPHQDPFDMYDDHDSTLDSYMGCGSKNDERVFFQVPIEELIIVARRAKRLCDASLKQQSPENSIDEPIIAFAYSLRANLFLPLVDPNASLGDRVSKYPWICHRCRRQVFRSKQNGEEIWTWWCKSCLRELKLSAKFQPNVAQTESQELLCDCSECIASSQFDLEGHFSTQVFKAIKTVASVEDIEDSAFVSTQIMIRSMSQADFGLAPDFLSRFTTYGKPVTKVKIKSPKKMRKIISPDKNSVDREKIKSKVTKSGFYSAGSTANAKEESIEFKPTSARLFSYNVSKRKFDASAIELFPWSGTVSAKDKPRNLRQEAQDQLRDTEREEKLTSGRAARVNQRRLMRDVAAIGMSLDTLGSREQALRFDRSTIHGWGVIADEDVREGEMLIEYRGEIIGNAMAEKREKEYENAKLGCDYMFRIDAHTVCDATKQGNVARFINASCDPNCYAKILTIDGAKRITVYAKKDIHSGQELTYDYKFPLEYDESKRILCNCGSKDCRGYMNWVGIRSKSFGYCFIFYFLPFFSLTPFFFPISRINGMW